MDVPQRPVELSVEQIDELSRELSNLRHDINNHLSLIIAANELIRYKPELLQRMTNTVTEQPQKINAAINKFSDLFEKSFGITRPSRDA